MDDHFLLITKQNEWLEKIYASMSSDWVSTLAQTTLGGILAASVGAVVAYCLTKKQTQYNQKLNGFNLQKSNILSLVSSYEILATEYWSRDRCEDGDKKSELFMKLTFTQIRRYYKIFQTFTICNKADRDINEAISRLYDISQGGSFESKLKSKSIHRASQSQIFCGKLISQIHGINSP
ncbi:MAG: hypothetical protein K6L80_03345 [Agarilytica sp.]